MGIDKELEARFKGLEARLAFCEKRIGVKKEKVSKPAAAALTEDVADKDPPATEAAAPETKNETLPIIKDVGPEDAPAATVTEAK